MFITEERLDALAGKIVEAAFAGDYERERAATRRYESAKRELARQEREERELDS